MPDCSVPLPAYDTPETRLQLAARLWDWVPHDGQRELLTMRLADGREPGVLVAACGRRWGKTEALSCDIALRLLTDTGLSQMGVAPTRDQAETLFDAVAEKIEAAQEDEWAQAQFPHLKTLQIRRSPYPHMRSGGNMVFSARTSGRTGRNLRGKGTTRSLPRFRVIIDERAFVPDEAVERAILPMLATVPGGGQLVEISSPNGKHGGFYAHFLKGEAETKADTGRYRAVRLPSIQNPLLDAAFLQEMRETMRPTAFRAEFEAEFTDETGTVFPDADIRAALCDDDYGTRPLWGETYIAGVDWGRRTDWTVVIIAAIGTNGLRVVSLTRLQGLTWAGQVERIAEILTHWNVLRAECDQTGLGDPVTETLRNAMRARKAKTDVRGFVFASGTKAALMDGLALALSQKRILFPPFPDLVGELGRFVATPLPGGGERMAASGSGHDDCVCALALAWEAGGDWVSAGGVGSRKAAAYREKEKEWDF